MRVYKTRRRCMCDTVRCKNHADFGIDLDLYLGEIHLCTNCLQKVACLLKKNEGDDGNVRTYGGNVKTKNR